MKKIYFYFILSLILLPLTSCEIDDESLGSLAYKFKNGQDYSMDSDIDFSELTEVKGFVNSSIDISLELFSADGQSIEKLTYDRLPLSFTAKYEVSYITATIKCFGHPYGHYLETELVCQLTTKPIYLSELDDTNIKLTDSDIESTTYSGVQAFKINVNSSVDETELAKKNGYNFSSKETKIEGYDETGNIVKTQTVSGNSDFFNSSANISWMIVVEDIFGYPRGSYSGKTKVCELKSKKYYLKDFNSSSITLDITESDIESCIYFARKCYQFSISERYSVLDYVANYGYNFASRETKINIYHSNGTLDRSLDYYDKMNVIPSAETDYFVIETKLYGYSKNSYYKKEHVCTLRSKRFDFKDFSSVDLNIEMSATDLVNIEYKLERCYEVTLNESFNLLNLVTEKGYRFASRNTTVYLYGGSGNLIKTYDYSSGNLYITPSSDKDYLVVVIDAYGYPKDSYYTKVKVCTITSKKFSFKDAIGTKLQLNLSEENFASITYP